MNDPRKIIAITLGDPAGVGPEITAKWRQVQGGQR